MDWHAGFVCGFVAAIAAVAMVLNILGHVAP